MMKTYLFNLFSIFLIHLFLSVSCDNEKSIFPFTSIKVVNDDIFFTLDKKRSEWHKLLSIDNIGADVFIRKAKEDFGELNCDYEIQCYKYNLIVNFEKVYFIVSNQKIPEHVSIEYLENNVKKQTGIDIESSQEKFKIYKSSKVRNINGN